MPRKRQRTESEQETIGPRPLWSGVIAFGLVSLPVSLFSANRSRTSGLSMVDKQGAPLRRQFFCSADNRPLEAGDLVRGYRLDNRYIVVEDDELEALEPKKSQEIDLRSFVPLNEIDPVLFERAYFIVPNQGATKPYRLLARSMEQAERAGIATFVMRDREYLVAIIAEQGILRAETLRFVDEIRSPEAIGLPPSPAAQNPQLKSKEQIPKSEIAPYEKAIRALTRKEFDPSDLVDEGAIALQALAQKKFARSPQDVITPEAGEEQAPPDNVIDLMQILKARLRGSTPPAQKAQKSPGTATTTKKRSTAAKGGATATKKSGTVTKKSAAAIKKSAAAIKNKATATTKKAVTSKKRTTASGNQATASKNKTATRPKGKRVRPKKTGD